MEKDIKRGFSFQGYKKLLQYLLELKIPIGGPNIVESLKLDAPKIVLRHDIHHLLAPAHELARIEADLGIAGAYFMMHDSSMVSKYYWYPETWDVLRDIQGLGHQIGMHVDCFEIIERYGNLHQGILEEIRKFRDEGISITIGNSHGNTAYSKRYNVYSNYFFQELFSGDPSQYADEYVDHIGATSLTKLGFRYWCDTALWSSDRGTLRAKIWVTDNGRKLWYGDSDSTLDAWDEYRLPSSNFERLGRVLSTSRGLISWLIHPQYYVDNIGSSVEFVEI